VKRENIRKLDVNSKEDLDIIHDMSKDRYNEPGGVTVEESEHILMWYCLNVFSEDIYYDEDGKFVVIFRDRGDELMIYDIISKERIDVMDVVSRIAKDTNKTAKMYFGSKEGINTSFSELNIHNNLFVRSKETIIPNGLVFRATSKA
jgi:hypothetical protein